MDTALAIESRSALLALSQLVSGSPRSVVEAGREILMGKKERTASAKIDPVDFSV